MGRRLREVLHGETRPLLAERVRGTCWIAAVAILFSIVPDRALPEPGRMLLIATKLGGVVASTLGIVLLRRLAAGAWRPLAWTSVTILSAILAVPVVGAIIYGDPLRAAFVLSFITMCTGVIFPWGARPQGAVATVAISGVLLATALRPTGTDVAANTLVAVCAVIVASVYLATVLDRQRRERARGDLLQEGQKRVLELVAQDAPLSDVFTALIDSVEEREPTLRACIRCLVQDGVHETLRLDAAPSLPSRFAEAVGSVRPGEARGTSATAASSRRRVITPDIAQDPIWDTDREVALSSGLLSCWAEPITSADGTLLGTICAFRSSTGEPSRSQTELLEIASNLAGIAIERAQSREALVQARDAAEEAARAKGEFVANMSHEIRTPLNGVIGMTGLLLDTRLDQEQNEYAGIIRTSGESLLSIINDILDFSKIESGRVELEQQPFEIARCVTEAMDLVALRAAEQHIELAYCLGPDVPKTILGDVTRVRQILANLLGNAVKFTEAGEVVVSVDVVTQTEDGYELAFSVRDTGIGIPPDRVDKLFQPFTQVDASTTRRYGGTGLGLVIARRFSEMMGGEMTVESEEGVGSTFRFSLRARPAPNAATDEPNLDVLRGKTLLVVDDNATNRLILEREARTWGMSVFSAESGDGALAWIDGGGTYDIAILDFLMPEMDGMALARELRERPTTQMVPRVLLSSVAADDMAVFRVDENARQEFAAILTKPVHLGHLGAVLATALGPETVKASRSPVAAGVDASLGDRHPLRVLLAEDNRINQRVAVKMLERMGYRADVAANGLEAVEAVARQPYDVVLMDMQMPEMDGVTATQRIRATLPKSAQPRIIAMTANASVQDRERCLAAGMDDFLSKPVVARDLGAALEQAVPIARADVTIPVTAQSL